MDFHYHLFVLAEPLMDQNLTTVHTEQTHSQKYLDFVHIYIYIERETERCMRIYKTSCEYTLLYCVPIRNILIAFSEFFIDVDITSPILEAGIICII